MEHVNVPSSSSNLHDNGCVCRNKVLKCWGPSVLVLTPLITSFLLNRNTHLLQHQILMCCNIKSSCATTSNPHVLQHQILNYLSHGIIISAHIAAGRNSPSALFSHGVEVPSLNPHIPFGLLPGLQHMLCTCFPTIKRSMTYHLRIFHVLLRLMTAV